jgi:hypothetical protein
VTVRELSEWIAEIESGESPPPRNIRQSAYVALHQTHLPKLDDMDVIEYNEQAKDITLRDTAEEVARYLDVRNSPPAPQHTVYIGAGLVGLALVAGSELGIPLLSAVPPTIWAYLLCAIVTLSASIQTAQHREWNLDDLWPSDG